MLILRDILNPDFKLEKTYPPYNIVKYYDENSSENEAFYTIEIAAAGFHRDDFNITVVKDSLVVHAKKPDPTEEELKERVVLHQGIGGRSFRLQFRLAENIEVGVADYHDGLLTIELKKVIPEAEMPRKIAITTG